MNSEEYFFEDDGDIPNSNLPLLVYRDAFRERDSAGAEWLEDHFAQHNWKNSWRNGVYNYHHYHSTSHEVLGVYAGRATLQLGGESGDAVDVAAGDLIIIPAGVGHKNLDCSGDFAVVGAYPNGKSYDLKTGKKGERPQADRNIAALDVPETDPLAGAKGGLRDIWKADGKREQ